MVFKERIATMFPAVNAEPALSVTLNNKTDLMSIPVFVSLFKIHFEKKYTLTIALRRENGEFVTSRDFNIEVQKSSGNGYIMSDGTVNITGQFTMGGISIENIKDGETMQLLGTLQVDSIFNPETSIFSYFEIRIR